MRICQNKITTELRRLFNANPLKVPQALYQPLLVLQVKNKRPQPLGQFEELVKGGFNHHIPVTTTEVAELAGERTKRIGLGIGLNLLNNFVQAFGMQPATIKGALNQTRQLSFAFQEVEHSRFSPLKLGKILSEHQVVADTENMFIRSIREDKKASLAIVTDVITSKSFSIQAYDDGDQEVAVDVAAINEYLGKAELGVTASSSSKNEIRFDNKVPLTFAFSCVEIRIDDQGQFSSGDWIDNLAAKNLEETEQPGQNDSLNRAKILFDEDEYNPLLIE